MIARRIIPRSELPPSMRRDAATNPARCCPNTIELDGSVYRCARDQHDGIHDALVQHDDGGAVRW